MRSPRSSSSFVAFLLLTLTAPEALAQVNTDSLRPAPTREGLGGGIDASVTVLGGNVNVVDVGLGGRLQTTTFFPSRPEDPPGLPWVQNLALLMGNAHYAARDGTKFLNQGLLHARFTRMWHRRVGTSVFAQHQFNEFQRLRVRSLWGTGVSLQIIRDAAFNLSGSTGYMLEHNSITVLPGAPDRPQTLEHRWSNFLGARLALWQDKLLAQSTTYFQPRFDDFADLRFLEEIEVLAKVTDTISFGTSLSVLVDTAPPTGVNTTDTRLASTVKLNL